MDGEAVMRRRRIALGVVALSLGVSALAGPGAWSEDVNEAAGQTVVVPAAASTRAEYSLIVGGKGPLPEITPDELADLRGYAEASGKGLAAVTARHRGQAQFNVLVDKIRASHPDIFVSAGLPSEQTDSDRWVRFTAMPPASVVSEFDNQPLRVQIMVVNSLSDSETELAYSTAQTTAKVLGVNLTGIAFDSVAETLTVEVDASQADVHGVLANALSAQLRANLGMDLPVGLRVETGAPGANEATVSGGRGMWIPGEYSTTVCTAGFTAVRNGNRGVVGARHCSAQNEYSGDPGIVTNCCYADPVAGGGIDLRFYRTTADHSTNKWFRALDMNDREVYSVANPNRDDIICHTGQASPDGLCSSVAVADPFCADMGSPWGLTCGMLSSENYISGGGDSGGPWYYGNQANGIHTGRNPDATRSRFTAISYIATRLDAQVLQN